MENCVNTGNMTANNTNGRAAGLVEVVGGSATVKNCLNTGNITGGAYVGGIASRITSDGTVSQCVNFGEISQRSNQST